MDTAAVMAATAARAAADSRSHSRKAPVKKARAFDGTGFFFELDDYFGVPPSNTEGVPSGAVAGVPLGVP